MAADEGAAEVDVLEVVLFGLEVGDLSDVVAEASQSRCIASIPMTA